MYSREEENRMRIYDLEKSNGRLKAENAKLRGALDCLLDGCKLAVERGDWIVDGACDLDLETFLDRHALDDNQ